MKKLGVLFMCGLLAFSGMHVKAGDIENPSAVVNVTDDSILRVYNDEAEISFEVSASNSLGYQEIVLPYGTDLENKYVYAGFDCSKIQFSMDEAEKEAYQITDEELTGAEGYYANIRQFSLYSMLTYSIDGSEYKDASTQPMLLEAGKNYTVAIEGNDMYACLKENGSVIARQKVNVRQGSKFAFTIRIAGPTVLEGETLKVTKGAEKECSVRVDKEFTSFKGVTCNGDLLVQGKDYTAKSGSTIVTFTPEFLKSLPTGDYTINVLFDDCESEPAILSIVNEDEPEGNADGVQNVGGDTKGNTNTIDKTANNAATPKTDDTGIASMWLVLMAGMLVLTGAAAKKHRI